MLLEKNMTFAKVAGTLGLVALAVIASPFAVAQDSVWYGGINIGQSMADIDRGRIRSGLLSGGLTTTMINVAKSWQFS